jgi:hypothetical protein
MPTPNRNHCNTRLDEKSGRGEPLLYDARGRTRLRRGSRAFALLVVSVRFNWGKHTLLNILVEQGHACDRRKFSGGYYGERGPGFV